MEFVDRMISFEARRPPAGLSYFEYAMRSSVEPDNFSTRLHQGLENIGFPSNSPVALAREFNRRHAGAAITVHATRKWLLGEAIPTQAKLRSIARWLDVSPEWLVFGEAQDASQHQAGIAEPTIGARIDTALIADLKQLDEAHRRLARQFVHKLLKLQAARAKDSIGPHSQML